MLCTLTGVTFEGNGERTCLEWFYDYMGGERLEYASKDDSFEEFSCKGKWKNRVRLVEVGSGQVCLR